MTLLGRAESYKDGVLHVAPDLVHLLIERGEPVASYPFSGMWFDIGTSGDHERAVEALDLGGESP